MRTDAERQPLDFSTPNAMAQGTAAGDYALTPQESINIANGGVDFVVPLRQIGGRGKADIP